MAKIKKQAENDDQKDTEDNAEKIDADVAIVGGGPAGYVAAIRCAQNGQKTVLIERNKLGGTCLNSGCIPTKFLVSIARWITKLKNADDLGITIPYYELSLEKIRNKKNEMVSNLVQGIAYLMEKNEIIVINGKAKVEGSGILSVEGRTEIITYKNLILATGSSENLISIPGADDQDILTSYELLELKEIPQSLTIIGGGVIGIELAFIYTAFGCKVYVVEFLPQILNFEDADVAAVVKRSAKKNGIQIYESAKVLNMALTRNNNKLITIERKGKIEYLTTQKVAMAVGRRANFDAIDLDKLGVKLNESRDGIKVNEYMQTSNPFVYSIGDVTNQGMLAHVASRQGIIASDYISGKRESMDLHLVPRAIFTNPEIGHMGYTEKEAKENHMEIMIGKFPFFANSKAVVMQETDGFVKVLAHKDTKEIIGATVVGPGATELLSLMTNLVSCHITLDEAERVIYAHPTLSEAISEAILNTEGKSIHFGN